MPTNSGSVTKAGVKQLAPQNWPTEFLNVSISLSGTGTQHRFVAPLVSWLSCCSTSVFFWSVTAEALDLRMALQRLRVVGGSNKDRLELAAAVAG